MGLLAAFPVAFAIIIPVVYFPIWWDGAFCGGSLLATFAQGVVLGSFIQGFKVEGRVFAESSFDFTTPFAFAASVALFALPFLGVTISLWPMIVPGHSML